MESPGKRKETPIRRAQVLVEMTQSASVEDD